MAAPVFVTDDVPSADQFNQWLVNTQFVVKSADEGISGSTTVQDDNHLTYAVDASATYAVKMVLFVTSNASANTGNIKWLFTAPSGAAMYATASGLDAATATTNLTTRIDYVDLTTTNHHAGISTTVYTPVVLDGLLVVSTTAGSLLLRWAQDVSNGTATTVRAGSYLQLTRVA